MAADRVDQVRSEVGPAESEALQGRDAHPEGTALPWLLEHKLAVITGQRRLPGERLVNVRQPGPRHPASRSGARGTAVPIMQSRVTSAVSSSSPRPSVPRSEEHT